MFYVSEEDVRQCVTQAAVTAAVADAFIAFASGEAQCWPTVRETLGHADAIFGFKSGIDRAGKAMGLKAGGLWPGNAARGVPNHQSTTLLFDIDSGAPSALVRSTALTALRTAAASALSIRCLARGDCETLGMIGAGGQGEAQLRAALAERPFRRLLVNDANAENAARLAELARSLGLAAATVDAQAAAREADVLITITPARSPVVLADWIRPGTHIAAMGADTVGKQELATDLVAHARLFGDVPEQAIHLGECQHAFRAGLIAASAITTLGDVLSGRDAGRRSADDVTIFDSTGMALQDLAAARVAIAAARRHGLGCDLA